MPRKKTLTLTNAEHRIMEVIWAQGSATVADVVEALEGKDAYTTILTLMRILKVKGYLSSRKEGRAFVFVPKVDRNTVARKAVHQLLSKFFAGSPSVNRAGPLSSCTATVSRITQFAVKQRNGGT